MRLALSFPSPWHVTREAGEQRIARSADVRVTFGPIVIKPDEPRRWLDILTDAPLRIGRTMDRTTTDGWPIRFVEVDLVDAQGAVIEARVCAFYTFMEHGAAAIASAPNRAELEAHGDALVAIFEAGRPDWRDVPLCLAECWDLGITSKRVAPRSVTPQRELEAALAEVAPSDHLRRGLILLELGRHREAADAFAVADDKLEAAHYYRGIALGAQGDHAAAIAAWQRSLALAPERADARYNIAQAQFLLEDYEAALAGFRSLDDVDARRKTIQCLYALERYAEGEAARAAFRDQLAADPRARHIAEYVFDQFKGDGFWVHAVEPVRPMPRPVQPVLEFRATRRDGGRETALGASVTIETSEQAKAAGTPFVVGVQSRGTFRVVDALHELPPYAQLRPMIARLLRDALG